MLQLLRSSYAYATDAYLWYDYWNFYIPCELVSIAVVAPDVWEGVSIWAEFGDVIIVPLAAASFHMPRLLMLLLEFSFDMDSVLPLECSLDAVDCLSLLLPLLEFLKLVFLDLLPCLVWFNWTSYFVATAPMFLAHHLSCWSFALLYCYYQHFWFLLKMLISFAASWWRVYISILRVFWSCSF